MLAHPRVAPIRPDHQRRAQASTIVEAQRCCVRADIERGRTRRAEQGHVVLALQALPDLDMHRAGLADPRELCETAVVGREHQLPTRVAVDTHLGDCREAVVVDMRPDAEVIEETRTRRTVSVDARVPAVGTARRRMLDHCDPQRTAPQRNGQRRTGETAADDDEVEFHGDPREFCTALDCARGRALPPRVSLRRRDLFLSKHKAPSIFECSGLCGSGLV